MSRFTDLESRVSSLERRNNELSENMGAIETYLGVELLRPPNKAIYERVCKKCKHLPMPLVNEMVFYGMVPNLVCGCSCHRTNAAAKA